jgi:hypothetical protein
MDRLARLTAPRIETTVAGMTLRGTSQLDVITLPDLDIVDRNDGVRLLPLLRILRLLEIEPRDSASVLVFRPDGAPVVTVDYAAGTASLGDNPPAAVRMIAGISDITDQPELYVQESALAAMLAMEVKWDSRLYEYQIHANRPLKIFTRRHQAGALARSSMIAAYDLPGRLPAARVHHSLLPVPQFTEVQMLSSLTAGQPGTGLVGSLPLPRVGLWADALGGSLVATVKQNTSPSGAGYQMEQVSWTAGMDRTAFSVGSVNFGLSELVFPSLSLIGAMANGRVGAGADDAYRDPSQQGRQQAFLPVHVFDGYARLGADVTLNINGQDVETRRIEPGPDAPPGEGPYSFEGVNLLSSRLNDVRIRVTAPDGSVEEIRRRVLGTDLLMDAGGVAFVGGFGGRRNPSAENLSSEGRFGGGRLNLGLTRRFSMGMSAAYQERLFAGDNLAIFGPDTLPRPPLRSQHVGSRLAWQPFDPVLLSTEAARSQAGTDSVADLAVRADAEYQLGELRLHPAAFRYGPRFFDGQDAELRDLTGASMGLLWRYGKGNEITLGGARMRDDLDGTKARALRSNDVLAGWSIHGVVPRSILTLGVRQIWFADAPDLRTGLLGLEGTLPGRWSVRVHQEFGDDIRRRLAERLPGGSTWRFDFSNRLASAPGGGTAIGVSSQTSSLELRRQLNDAWQVSLAHRTLGAFRRSTVDLSRTAPPNGLWQARLSPGFEWDSRSLFLQNRIEFFLGRSHGNRLVLENQLLHHQWLVRFSVQIQTDVGFTGTRPVPLFDSRLDPNSGGVKGRVFLDGNGNGLPDPGEPGLSGIEVITDQGRQTVSTGNGLFVFSNSASMRRTRVSLQPETLPATYSLTQATQEAILRPGVFTEVNLGVAVLGTISGSVMVLPDPDGTGSETGVSGVRVVLLDPAGKEAGNSITGSDGLYTISDIRPGSYRVRLDESTLPVDFVQVTRELPLEVQSQSEPFEKKDMNFTGRYANPQLASTHTEDGNGVVYKVFTRSSVPVLAPTRPVPAEQRSRRAGSAGPSTGTPVGQPKSKPVPPKASPATAPTGALVTPGPAQALATGPAVMPDPAKDPAAALLPAPAPAPALLASAEPIATPAPPTAPPLAPAPALLASVEPIATPTAPAASAPARASAPEPAPAPAPALLASAGPIATPTAPASAPRFVLAERVITDVPAPAETAAVVPPSPAPDLGGALRVAYGRTVAATPPRPAPDAPCDCQLEGTVELRSERPLRREVVVTVSLADAPAIRDSVELFMGSPRPFRLGAVPCGAHELTVRTWSSQRFTVIAPAPAKFDCSGGVRQIRVVLESR